MGINYRSPFGFGFVCKVGLCWFLETLQERNQIIADLATSVYLDQMLAWDCLIPA
jgi:hypothetical protein